MPDPKMVAYRNAVLKMSARFEGLEFHHVARENNQAADILARIGAKRDPVPPNIFLEKLFKPTWYGKGTLATIVRIQPQPQIPNTLTQSEALPSK